MLLLAWCAVQRFRPAQEQLETCLRVPACIAGLVWMLRHGKGQNACKVRRLCVIRTRQLLSSCRELPNGR